MQFLLTQEELDEKESVFQQEYQKKIKALQDRFIKVFRSYGAYSPKSFDSYSNPLNNNSQFDNLLKDLKDAFHDETKAEKPKVEELIKEQQKTSPHS